MGWETERKEERGIKKKQLLPILATIVELACMYYYVCMYIPHRQMLFGP